MPSIPAPQEQGWTAGRDPSRVSELAAERQGGGGKGLRLLAPESSGLAGGLNRGLFDVGDGPFQSVGVLR